MRRLFFFFLLLLFLSFIGVRSEDSAPEEKFALLRLLSDDARSGHQAICATNSPPLACPVRCFRPNPVCGEDGITYWCGCADAACSGVRVAKLGYCEVGNGGSGLLSGQALLLVHIVWLIALAFSVVLGLF